MRRALELAERGWGRVSPNPLVGAVVVNDDRVVGEGFHTGPGTAHAERAALVAAGEAARGGTMFSTLEPCRHHGRTPPCTEAILEAGVRRVVYAAADPTTQAGGGGDELRAAGVEVVSGVLAEEAVRLNAPFLWTAATGRPLVILKLALSADGAIAAGPGERTAISCSESWAEVHRLRSGVDAILVGSRTVEADDPLLTPRGSPMPARNPLRVVLASDGRIDPSAALVRTAGENPVVVYVSASGPAPGTRALEEAGVTVAPVAALPDGRLDPAAVLDDLARRDVQAVLVEGGREVAGSFLEFDLVQRYHEFVAPSELGAGAVPGPSQAPSTGMAGWRRMVDREAGVDTYTVWERSAAYDRLLEAA
jgi:diaminohydroxyphosphoribosylaminopyrimidine deaminase/5-amino-6-(5-phosphoribosylamino)uracil reductase